jgi:hypothetical protein
MNRSALTEEAFQALLRLKQDMYAAAVLARLQVFVNENADAFERVTKLRVVQSAAG